eukprot:3411-Heterococcus_DN1.PRE.1
MTLKQTAEASDTPLYDESMLLQIFDFVGTGSFILVGPVVHCLQIAFASRHTLLACLSGDDDRLVEQLCCYSRSSLASAVSATPATVPWACSSGVAFVDSEESPFSAAKWHCSAGKYTDHLTLKKAEEFWLQLDDEYVLDGVPRL